MAVNIHGLPPLSNMRIDSHVTMDIDDWTHEMRSQSDHTKSYRSSCQPPSIGNVREMVVSEPSRSYQMYSDGQPPSVNDVCRREASQSEASCNRYEGRDEQEVQQLKSELNDGVYKRGAAGRSNDIIAYSGYDEPTQDLMLRFGSKDSHTFAVPEVLLRMGSKDSHTSAVPEVLLKMGSKVSQSFAVPESRYNILDTSELAITESGFLNGGILVPPQRPFQRMRTYTKVYKRGTPEKSIDITTYSGYDELREDLAMIFGIEGLLDHPLKTGWQLLFVDYKNDVLLHRDNTWPEFVNRIHYISILSPQEVQQISLQQLSGGTV